MSRTTDEWAALLDGTTPGPWTVVETAYRRAICRIRDDGQSGWAVALTLDHDQPDLDEANAALVAAAPDAVAEVIRLRRAITDLRDDYLEHIADYDESTVTHMCYGTAADDLDRILNGDSALAGDALEYRVEHQNIRNGSWHPVTKWSPEWPLNDGHSVAPDERIVCRRVSAPWEVTDD